MIELTQSTSRGIVLKIGRVFIAVALVITGLASGAANAQDMRYRFPKQMTASPMGVNLQTGRFNYSKTDFSIGTLKFVRSWGETPAVSAAPPMGTLATYSDNAIMGWAAPNSGWSHNFNQGVAYVGATGYFLASIHVVVNGQEYRFGKIGDGSILPATQGSQGTALILSSGQWQFTDRSGARYVFFAHPALAQGGTPGLQQVLQSVTHADESRTDYAYDASGRPEFIRDSRGYAIGLEYGAQGGVSSACGFNIAKTHADAATPCTSALLRVQYGYNPSGTQLTSVTDVKGNVVTMTYQTTTIGSLLLTCISLPNSGTCEVQNVYGAGAGAIMNYADQVRRQTSANGQNWSYSFTPQPNPADVPIVPGMPRYSMGWMVDPAGSPYSFSYDRGHLVEARTPSPASTNPNDWMPTQYRYAYMKLDVYPSNTLDPPTYQYHDDLPRLITAPEGNNQYLFHDTRGNVSMHSYWPKGSPNPAQHPTPALIDCCTVAGIVAPPAGANTYYQTFPSDAGVISAFGHVYVLGCGSGAADAKRCDKPLTATDAKGQVTTYTYDAAHGGILTETLPAVNGITPQKRYEYAQRYAWVKNSGGTFVQSASPMWLKTRERSCRTTASSGATCAGGAADEVITDYDYGPDSGPNNLLLRGVIVTADGQSLRTCYGYDEMGRKISETQPAANLGSCS